MHHPDIVDHRSDIDKSRALRFRDPARGRPEVGPSMGDTLRGEVSRAERRLALAQEQLRLWLREHPEEGEADT